MVSQQKAPISDTIVMQADFTARTACTAHVHHGGCMSPRGDVTRVTDVAQQWGRGCLRASGCLPASD